MSDLDDASGSADGFDDPEEDNTMPTSMLSDGHPPKKKARRGAAPENVALYAEFRKLPEKYTSSNKTYDTHVCVCKHCEAAAATTAAQDETTTNNNNSTVKKIHMVHRDCKNHLKSCMHYLQACQNEGREAIYYVEKTAENSASSVGSHNGGGGGGGKKTTTALPKIAGSSILPSTFEVYVEKDTFKFNAAHFVAFQGYRERLHGHNYRVGVRLQGCRQQIGADGYVIDYGNIKKVCKDICKELNEHFLCPLYSDVMTITYKNGNADDEMINNNNNNNNNEGNGGNTSTNGTSNRNTKKNRVVRLECAVDGTYFEFPEADCKMLPIVHATTEELAIYLWSQVVDRLDASYLRARGLSSLELTVAEAPGQQATFRYPIPASSSSPPLDVRQFVQTGQVVPMPCLESESSQKKQQHASCSSGGACPSANQLASLTAAMQAQGLLTRQVSPEDLQALLNTATATNTNNGNTDDTNA